MLELQVFLKRFEYANQMQNRLEAWIETDLQLKLLEPLTYLQESTVSLWNNLF